MSKLFWQDPLFWQETKVQTWRWFLHSKRRPVVVISGLFQPVIWMTLFALVFRKSPMAALGGEGGYLAFITPSALLFTSLNASLNAGIPILFDREMGFLDRLRAAPLTDRFSIVLSSAIHISVMTLLQCVVIGIGAMICGVSFQGGVTGWLLVGAILLLVTLGFTSISLGLAFKFKRHFEMIAIVMIVTMPVIFLSSAFAPLENLPTWLQTAVLFNPVTLGIEPIRAAYLSPDWALSSEVIESSLFGSITLLHCMIGLVVFNVLAAFWGRKVLKNQLA